MTDAADAVAEAITLNRQLAARHLVRVQDLQAEVAKCKRAREAASSDDAAAIDATLAAKTTELAAATHDYQAALAELKELERLGHQAQTLDARSIVASIEGDPLIRTPEQIALDNVRDHAANLDAQVRLADELCERPTAPTPPPSREEADEAARREFDALRAKPKKTL